MEALYVIVPLAIAFAGFALMGFIWAVRDVQFDDSDGAAHRALLDDEK